MKFLTIPAIFLAMALSDIPGCHAPEEHEAHEEHHHKIVVTSPIVEDVTTTQQYVCRIQSCRHIEVRALDNGYLEKVLIQEGQTVKEGDLLFKILPVLYKARLDTDMAEAKQAEIELYNSQKLFSQNIVSNQDVALAQAKLAKAQAKVSLARAELGFTDVTAPFSGIVDRQYKQLGSLVDEGDMLTTLSDNSTMWVFFNVPEARYLEYMENLKKPQDGLKVELRLANGNVFNQEGKIATVEADFDIHTGNIPFRADFPNPDRLLRNSQTGTILISRVQHGATVIPQRCVYEILAKRYVWIVGEDNVVHQREIKIANELEDIYLIEEGIEPGEKIVLEGTQQVRDGDKVEYEFEAPEKVLSHLKYHAE